MIRVNTNGIHEIDFNFDGTTTAAITSPGVVTVTHAGVATGITQLTGDVTAGPGSGSVAATLSNTSTARSHLGLGTMAVQNATAVAITGGTVDGTTVGATTPAAVTGTVVEGKDGILGGNLGPASPSSYLLGGSAILGWNMTGGGGEVDIINCNTTPNNGFSFYTATTPGTVPSTPVATISPVGVIRGNSLVIASGGGGSLTFQDGTTQSTAATTPSGTANEVYATPNGSSGAAALRALAPADLPVATTSALGAVKPDGTTITVSAGVISAAGGSGYSLGSTVNASNVALGIGAGSGATVGTVAGLDGNHQVLFTAGSGATAPDDLWTFTFTTSRGHNTYPVVTGQIPVLVAASSATSYTVSSIGTAPTNGVVYTFNVSCP